MPSPFESLARAFGQAHAAAQKASSEVSVQGPNPQVHTPSSFLSRKQFESDEGPVKLVKVVAFIERESGSDVGRYSYKELDVQTREEIPERERDHLWIHDSGVEVAADTVVLAFDEVSFMWTSTMDLGDGGGGTCCDHSFRATRRYYDDTISMAAHSSEVMLFRNVDPSREDLGNITFYGAHDEGGNFNLAGGYYTCPEPGYYQFSVGLRGWGADYFYIYLQVSVDDGVSWLSVEQFYIASPQSFAWSGNYCFYEGDRVRVLASNASDSEAWILPEAFSGSMLYSSVGTTPVPPIYPDTLFVTGDGEVMTTASDPDMEAVAGMYTRTDDDGNGNPQWLGGDSDLISIGYDQGRWRISGSSGNYILGNGGLSEYLGDYTDAQGSATGTATVSDT
jgi:hypothetical protein